MSSNLLRIVLPTYSALLVFLLQICATESRGCYDSGDVTINVLVLQGASSIEALAVPFENSTNNQVKVSIHRTSLLTDLLDTVKSDLTQGTNIYDGYIALPHWIAEFTEAGYLMDLSDAVRNSELNWADIFSVFRSSVAAKGRIYGIPMDGDLILQYYRRDLFERDGVSVPQTWDEFFEVARFYQGKDLNGDGVPDYGLCQMSGRDDNTPRIIFAILASFASKRDLGMGLWFDFKLGGMTPLVENEAVEATLRMYTDMFNFSQPFYVDRLQATQAFLDGRCAITLGYPSVPSGLPCVPPNGTGTCKGATAWPYARGRTGTARLPGSPKVLDRSTGKLVPCHLDICSSPTLNHVTLVAGGGGLTAIINDKAPPEIKAAMVDFWSFVSPRLDVTVPASVHNLFRKTHLDPHMFERGGWDYWDADSYINTTRDTMDKLFVKDLLMPYSADIGFLYVDAYHRVQKREMTPAESTKQLYRDVDHVLVQRGRTYLENLHRISLGLGSAFRPYEYPSFLLPLTLALSCLVAVALLACAVVFYRNRKTVVVKSSSFVFSALVLVSGALAALCSILFAVVPTDGVCTARTWLTPLTLTAMLAPLFLKAHRIHRIFNTKRLGVRMISNKHLLKFQGAITLAVVGVLTVFEVTPGERARVEVVENVSLGYYAVTQCTYSQPLILALVIFVGALNAWGAYLAFRTRQVPLAFNESSHMTFGICFLLLYGAVMVPLQFALDDPLPLAVLRVVGLVLGVAVCTGAVFVPKLMLLFTGRANDRALTVTEALGKMGRELPVPSAIAGAFHKWIKQLVNKGGDDPASDAERLKLLRALCERAGVSPGHSVEKSLQGLSKTFEKEVVQALRRSGGSSSSAGADPEGISMDRV